MAEHIDSYYARTAAPVPDYPAIQGAIETEIVIVGGGLAGLSAALSLIERGKTSIVLVEANRIGWGASGRNGGFVGPGFAGGTDALMKRTGLGEAQKLYALSVEAAKLVRSRIDRYAIPAQPTPGGVLCGWWRDRPNEVHQEQEKMARDFGVVSEFWPRDKVRSVCKTERYHDGLYFPGNFHFHPLNYCRGVAQAIVKQGGRIFEQSRVTRLSLEGTIKSVTTAQGQIRAKTVILACGGYIGDLEPRLARALKAVGTYVLVTEPLGERLKTVIDGNQAIVDSRFDFDYYRPLPDSRILWGGGISIFGENPIGLGRWLRRRMLTVYPQLADVKVETVWGGLMGYPTHKTPQLGQLEPGVWYCMGYGGHGMGTTAMTGELVAAAIAEGDRRYELLAPFGLDWAGGSIGTLYAQMVYWYYQSRDALPF